MENNKHTKGKWQINLTEDFPEEILDEKDNLIARLRWEDGQPFGFRSTEETEANARLIVKAVNNHDKLIEALKLSYEYFSKFSFEWEGRNTTEGQYILAKMRSTLNSLGAIDQ